MKTYGTKRILPVYGNSRPLERRINNVRIAGWKEQTFNATSVSQNDTYNDSAYLRIYGKSEQLITENSPSPDYPSTINSVSNFDLIGSDGEEQTQTINFPYTLRSLPDGTKDYIEIDNVAKTAKLVRNVGSYTVTGAENWTEYKANVYQFYKFVENVVVPSTVLNNPVLQSTHFVARSADAVSNHSTTLPGTALFSAASKFLWFRSPTHNTVNDFKAWLTYQHATGTPVTVQYQLATPTITNLDYEEIKTYYPYTNIYTNATIQPTLEGSLKIIDRDEE